LFVFNQVVLFTRIYAALHDEDVLTYFRLTKAVIFNCKMNWNLKSYNFSRILRNLSTYSFHMSCWC